jgi:ATP-dependent RNA helicase MSS116
MVFLPTARAAALYHDVFSALPIAFPVWEIHSRMSQSKRTKSTDEFRAAEKGVLFSSDVTARGIDVKGVTSVIQVGLPSSAEQCKCAGWSLSR